jgi:hypothetical protein
MRTTVTLDADVERLLKDEAHRTKRGFKAVLNDAVRSALARKEAGAVKLRKPAIMGLRVGIDPRRLNDIEGDLDAKAFLETTGRLLKKRQ